ncbi:MAG: DUF6348 family protein [Bacteroidota bacterium]|nr:DUF6348 family protein [Bacteroidota bacterium]
MKLIKYLLVVLPFIGCMTDVKHSKKYHNDINNANTAIAELLKSHNIEYELKADEVVAKLKNKIHFDSRILPNNTPQDPSCRLDLKITLEDGREIMESFGDAGETIKDAKINNIQNFVTNDFHVIINAFNDTVDEQILVEEWTINDIDYKVYIGNFGVKSTCEFNIPDNTFEFIEGVIKKQKFEKDYHWVRFYYGHLNKEHAAHEFIIDNNLNEDATNEITLLPWEKLDAFYSIRCFIILRRKISTHNN